MNTRSHVLELTVTPVQVEGVIKALFHTILLHRTTGKYSYANPSSGTFSVGTVGVEDVDCTSFDFTYVRCASEELDEWLGDKIKGFTSSLCQQGGTNSGKISLEFFERKKARWLLPPEVVNWEVWHLHLVIIEPSSDQGWHNHTMQLANSLPESVSDLSLTVRILLNGDELLMYMYMYTLRSVGNTGYTTVLSEVHFPVCRSELYCRWPP